MNSKMKGSIDQTETIWIALQTYNLNVSRYTCERGWGCVSPPPLPEASIQYAGTRIPSSRFSGLLNVTKITLTKSGNRNQTCFSQTLDRGKSEKRGFWKAFEIDWKTSSDRLCGEWILICSAIWTRGERAQGDSITLNLK